MLPKRDGVSSRTRMVETLKDSSVETRRKLAQNRSPSTNHIVRDDSVNNGGGSGIKQRKNTYCPTSAKRQRINYSKLKSTGSPQIPSTSQLPVSNLRRTTVVKDRGSQQKKRESSVKSRHSSKRILISAEVQTLTTDCSPQNRSKSRELTPKCISSTSKVSSNRPLSLRSSGRKQPQPTRATGGSTCSSKRKTLSSSGRSTSRHSKKSPTREVTQDHQVQHQCDKKTPPSSGAKRAANYRRKDERRSLEHGACKSLDFKKDSPGRKIKFKPTNKSAGVNNDKKALTATAETMTTMRRRSMDTGTRKYIKVEKLSPCALASTNSENPELEETRMAHGSMNNAPDNGSSTKDGKGGTHSSIIAIRDTCSSQSLIDEHNYCAAGTVTTRTADTDNGKGSHIDRNADRVIHRRRSNTDKVTVPAEKDTNNDNETVDPREKGVDTPGCKKIPEPKKSQVKGDNRTKQKTPSAGRYSKKVTDTRSSNVSFSASCQPAGLSLPDDVGISIGTVVNRESDMADHYDTRKRKRDSTDDFKTDTAIMKKTKHKIDRVRTNTIAASSRQDNLPTSSSKKQPASSPTSTSRTPEHTQMEREVFMRIPKSINTNPQQGKSMMVSVSSGERTGTCNEKGEKAKTVVGLKCKTMVQKNSPWSYEESAVRRETRGRVGKNGPSSHIKMAKNTSHIRKTKMVSLLKSSVSRTSCDGDQMSDKSNNSNNDVRIAGCSTSVSSSIILTQNIHSDANVTFMNTDELTSREEDNTTEVRAYGTLSTNPPEWPTENENIITNLDSVQPLTPANSSCGSIQALESSLERKSTGGTGLMQECEIVDHPSEDNTNFEANTATEGTPISAEFDSGASTADSPTTVQTGTFLVPKKSATGTYSPIEAVAQTSEVTSDALTQTSRVNMTQKTSEAVTQAVMVDMKQKTTKGVIQISSVAVTESTTPEKTKTSTFPINETQSCISIDKKTAAFFGMLTPKRSARLLDRSPGTPKKYEDFVTLPLRIREKSSPKQKDSPLLSSEKKDGVEPVIRQEPISLDEKYLGSRLGESTVGYNMTGVVQSQTEYRLQSMPGTNISQDQFPKLVKDKISEEENLQEKTVQRTYSCTPAETGSCIISTAQKTSCETPSISLPQTDKCQDPGSTVHDKSTRDDRLAPEVPVKSAQQEIEFCSALALSRPSSHHPEQDFSRDATSTVITKTAVCAEVTAEVFDRGSRTKMSNLTAKAREKHVSDVVVIKNGPRNREENRAMNPKKTPEAAYETSKMSIAFGSGTTGSGTHGPHTPGPTTGTSVACTSHTGTSTRNPLKLRFKRTSQGLAIASLLLSDCGTTNESISESPQPSFLKKRRMEGPEETPSPSPSKRGRAKAKTKGVVKKKINWDDVMRNQIFSEHAFTLWKSEKEWEFQRLHQEKTQSAILDIEKATWCDLPEEFKRKYFVRVLGALTDENKHSPESFYPKLDLLEPNKETNPRPGNKVEIKDALQIEVDKKVQNFLLFSIKKQHDILRHHFTWFQRMLAKEHYSQFVISIKQKLRQSKTQWRSLSKEEAEQTSRDVMFREICVRKYELKQREAKEREEATVSFNRQFEHFVNQLLTEGEADFDPSVRCQLLRRALMDVQELENESRVAVKGDAIASESFEKLVQEIRSTESKVQGQDARTSASGRTESVSNSPQNCDTRESEIWGELPLLSDGNTFAEQLLQELAHDALPPLDVSLLEDYLQADGQSMAVDCNQTEADLQDVLTSLIEDAIVSMDNLSQGTACCELNSPSCILSSLLLIEKLSNAKGRSSV